MELIEPRIPMVTAFSANKGGVGKTGQAILTANCPGAAGKRVLVIDMYFNNSATFYFPCARFKTTAFRRSALSV